MIKVDGKIVVAPPAKTENNNGEKPYRVFYSIDCHAKTPLEAAMYVEGCLNEMLYRPELEVVDSDGTIHCIDLEDEDGEQMKELKNE